MFVEVVFVKLILKSMKLSQLKINDNIVFFLRPVYPTLTGEAVILILPHDTASSGLAPESLPSNSCPVFTNTEKSAPLR